MFGTFPSGSFMWTKKSCRKVTPQVSSEYNHRRHSVLPRSPALEAERADRWICWCAYSTDWWVCDQCARWRAGLEALMRTATPSCLQVAWFSPGTPSWKQQAVLHVQYSEEKWGVEQDYSLSVQLLEILAIWVICSFALHTSSSYGTIRVVYILVF